MTEEIIIDGVNVAGCKYFNRFRNICHNKNLCCDCEKNQDCYYRQLKRLEQENEKLKKEVKQIGSDFIKKGDCARELEKENKSLDEEKNCLHKIIDRLLENAGYSKDIASAEDFEDVYEDMQIKRNELIELEQENKELKDKITALEDKLQLRMASDKESDAYWDEIFSAEDYPFNKENAYKELNDYYFVLKQIPKIYMEITGGTLSKTTYFASSVIQAYNDALERYYDKIDDLEYNNNAYRSALEKIKNKAENYEIIMRKTDLYEDDCNNCPKSALKEIISMINEVLNENKSSK